jgi:hypothetical protein
MWKVVYATHEMNYPNFEFHEETLKKKMQETLKELKTNTSNEEGLDEIMLTCLKSIDIHAMCNFLKH